MADSPLRKLVGLDKAQQQNLIDSLPDDELRELTLEWAKESARARLENQLVYYEPVSPKVEKYHASLDQTIGLFGGKGSSKTDSSIVELCIQATGIVPDSLKDIYPKEKLKPKGKFRMIVESGKTTLYPIILPKLQWWRWDGVDDPGGRRGHWGWIPRHCLLEGDWKKSWNDKLGILTLSTGSTIQFMSYSQDAEDFASGAFNGIWHDEPPKHAIWRESVARVGRYNGRLYVSMTPPDDSGIDVSWIFDDIYEPGLEGSPTKKDGFLSLNLFAVENKFIDTHAALERAKQLPYEQRQVYLYGKFIHLGGLIHPAFTDFHERWCFVCHQKTELADGDCARCGTNNTEMFCHVEDFEYKSTWPVIMVLDPHPRKPHMIIWVAVTPYDEYLQIAETKIDGECREVAEAVAEVEDLYRMSVKMRIIDPNMGQSPSTSGTRSVSWIEDFREAGLDCVLGDDNFEVGRTRINSYMAVDKDTRKPRLTIHPRCQDTIYQFKRYVYASNAKFSEKELKQTANAKNDDFPTMWRYCLNQNMDFTALQSVGHVFKPAGVGRNSMTGY
jgi:phage terminase large subunit-like protein